MTGTSTRWSPSLSWRGRGDNPDVPEWLRNDYFEAIQELARIGAAEILGSKDVESTRAMLSILAIAKDARTHARFLLEYSSDELVDLEKRTYSTTS